MCITHCIRNDHGILFWSLRPPQVYLIPVNKTDQRHLQDRHSSWLAAWLKRFLFSHGPSIRRWKQKSVRQRHSEPSVVCHARQALSAVTGMPRYLQERKYTMWESEDHRTILRSRCVSSRSYQRLISANRWVKSNDTSVWLFYGSHVATRLCDHPGELSVRVYLLSTARHSMGKLVGPVPRNRKTVSRLDDNRSRDKSCGMRASTSDKSWRQDSHLSKKINQATHPNLIEHLHRQILGVLWRLVSSGDGTGGKTSIYLLQGLLGAAISPLYV